MTIHFEPYQIKETEKKLITERRKKIDKLDSNAPYVGFALSGGGIRSATFCLGIFQALSKLKDANATPKIHKIDYISTVSGGGYFGAFLGRLFSREQAENIPKILSDSRYPQIQWLRENGRYLSPNGSGDLFRSISISIRNWISVQVVMASLVILAFYILHFGEYHLLSQLMSMNISEKLSFEVFGHDDYIWWSNWWFLPAAGIFVLTIPPGWAYWMVGVKKLQLKSLSISEIKESWQKSIFWISPLFGLALTTLLSLGYALWCEAATPPLSWIFFSLCILTWIYWGYAQFQAQSGSSGTNADSANIYIDDCARHTLTSAMKFGLTITLVLLVLAGIDTLAKSLLLPFVNKNFVNPLSIAWGLVFTLCSIVTPYVTRIQNWLGSLQKGKGLELSMDWLGQIAGFTIISIVLISLDALSYALLWNFPSSATPEAINTHSHLILAVLFAFSWLFGRNWSFLNRSSLHAMYSSRLTRAYLGASNPKRHSAKTDEQKIAIVDVLPDDDIDLDTYYTQALSHGGPLHLINITVNQTVDSLSQIQQQDRKGYSLSIGPAGYSVGGTNLHAIDSRSYPSHHAAPSEDISLGQSVAISGAAFSTGMGGQTGIGLSLLTGFFNIRLGYWWDAEAWTPPNRRADWFTKASAAFGWLFPTQSYILDEYLARFHGPAKALWNLSDGGHYENMGAYELIRRKIPKIVIIDAEADPEYQFEGLGILVRKARIDFKAEIEFLDQDRLKDLATRDNSELPEWIGTLESVKNGKAYAAIAQVDHNGDDTRQTSLLLYIKAAVVGDEPMDILHYRATHPDFPQQSTADQFFDEAQWESYRKLGDHIGNSIFADDFISKVFI